MVVTDELGGPGVRPSQGSGKEGLRVESRLQSTSLSTYPTPDSDVRQALAALAVRNSSTDSDRVRTAGFQIPGPGMLSVCLGRLLTQGVQVCSEQLYYLCGVHTLRISISSYHITIYNQLSSNRAVVTL